MKSDTTANKYIYTKVKSYDQSDFVILSMIIFTGPQGCVQKLQASNIPYGTYALCASSTIALLQIVGLIVSFLLFRMFDYLDALS